MLVVHSFYVLGFYLLIENKQNLLTIKESWPSDPFKRLKVRNKPRTKVNWLP